MLASRFVMYEYKEALACRQHNFIVNNVKVIIIRQHVSTNHGHLQAIQHHK
jgi:hypothetical protein